MKVLRVVAAAALALVLTACGGSDDDSSSAPSSAAATPADFDLPKGVKLTPGGTRLTEDQAATVVYQVGDNAASAVTVTVSAVRKGVIEDFRFFSLDAETMAASPFYVDLTVVNEGPAGLGGLALPVFAHDDQNTLLPPSEIVGSFAPCPAGRLPENFLPGDETTLCLVYLVPAGHALVSVDLQPGEPEDAIRWTP